jgi:glycosyltransferase 2 family protein
MRKKQVLIYGLVLAIFIVLVYLQFRTWRDFDWATFWRQTDHVSLWHVAAGVGIIYLAYVMRAIRWAIFLRPVRKTSTLKLLTPTILGFTGLAVLGRPGELIRPYLIARREDLPFSSQIAVWAVERIFDVGAFTVLLVVAIFFASHLRTLAYYDGLRKAGFLLIALVAGLAVATAVVNWQGEALARWVEGKSAHLASSLGHEIALRIREFRSGLDTIHGPLELAQLVVVSVLMWAMIAGAYWQVTHSYAVTSLNLPISQLLVLMGSSMIGSVVQLPGVGGGSQLATIAALQHIFAVPPELAASCGIMLWLVSFVAVVPLGLALAQRERLSFRKLSDESHRQEASGGIEAPLREDL